ncbi:hypothetical protein SACIG1267_2163 [Staphylococcus aureus subsp. aureus CIG1267]|nr:hypothetical protein FORC1_1500 [Staphylococcus aureus]EHT74558.1 hypothetical protein SACIG1267_2163 [Staphylococcus aureus subsp. aureus CIG1267]EHT85094.1 hypothetical protein SACIGC341D_2384 [Staphylococcus aureus subsp. aureus CIGC341D]
MKPPICATIFIFDINRETPTNITNAINNCPNIFLLNVFETYIIAKIDPIRPNIAPLAPTEIVVVLNDSDTKFPNSPAIKYTVNILHEPIIASTILPKINNESIFISICSKLKCKNIDVTIRYHSPCTTLKCTNPPTSNNFTSEKLFKYKIIHNHIKTFTNIIVYVAGENFCIYLSKKLSVNTLRL